MMRGLAATLLAFWPIHVALGAVGSATSGGGRSSTMPYSYSLTTFDPSGRLQQLEFALRSVDRTPGAVAIVTDEGVLLAKFSTGSLPKLHVCRVTESVAMTYAGSEADFRYLANKCIAMAVEHIREYGVEASLASLADDLSGLVQEHTQVAGLRPFGCSVLLAGRDDYGVECFKIDPSGFVSPWRATAIGKHSADVQDELATALPEIKSVDDAIEFVRKIKPVVTATFIRDSSSDDDSGRDGGDDRSARRFHTSLAVVRRVPHPKNAEIYGDIDDYNRQPPDSNATQPSEASAEPAHDQPT